MMCPKSTCGFNNTEQAVFCASCGAPLPQTALGPEVRGLGSEKPKRYASDRNCFLATIVAFFPGAGQLYNGDYKKAAIFYLLWVVCLALEVPTGSLINIVGLGLYGWSIFDAYSVAKRQKALW